MEIKGKIAVVTGGACGLGAATTRKLAGQGAKLVLNLNGEDFISANNEHVFGAITQKEKTLFIYLYIQHRHNTYRCGH